jgi:hypothetical protein
MGVGCARPSADEMMLGKARMRAASFVSISTKKKCGGTRKVKTRRFKQFKFKVGEVYLLRQGANCPHQ